MVGGACSQSPECGADAARSLALSNSQTVLETSSDRWFIIIIIIIKEIYRAQDRPKATIMRYKLI